MTARLGFVGVGRHAQKMAAAFRECGAEVHAHDRFGVDAADGFGVRLDWRDQIASPNIDALIICAPPEVTTEVALACAKAGKRCVATKPLMVSSVESIWSKRWLESDRSSTRPDTRLFVDLWRIYSPAWQALKAELRGKQIQSVHVDFYGNGPVRSFSGLLDYGPHALAFTLDLVGCPSKWTTEPLTTEDMWSTRWRANASADILTFYGNGASEPRRRVEVTTNSGKQYTWLEEGDEQRLETDYASGHRLMKCNRNLALRSFCRAFLSGEPSDTLRLSCEAMKVLMPLVG